MSRYSGQYAASSDSSRLLEIFADSSKIAGASKNPDTARARFELAVELYHQLMSSPVSDDMRKRIHDDMSELAERFPEQVLLNEALGLREKAQKLKTRRKKLELLQRARTVLEDGLAADSNVSPKLESALRQVLEEIAGLSDELQ